MKQFELNGMVVHLSEKVGTIIKSEIVVETKVSSSGGGGGNSPNITSTSTKKA